MIENGCFVICKSKMQFVRCSESATSGLSLFGRVAAFFFYVTRTVDSVAGQSGVLRQAFHK